MTRSPGKIIKFTVCLVLNAFIVSGVKADNFVNQRIYNLFMDNRSCVFFKLSGVSGNPAVPGDWFALSTSHPNFATLNAYLLSARLANTPVTVATDTSGACGWTNVVSVQLP